MVGGGAYNHTFVYSPSGNIENRVERPLVCNPTCAWGAATTYTYTYGDAAHKHAVTSVSGGQSFSYDAAGNRVKTVKPGGKTSYFPFPGYEEEVNGATTTRRVAYAIAGQTVALRVQVVGGSNTLYYLHADHLGSTSLATTTAGAVVSGSTARYLPFGGWRTQPTAGLTDIGFTGHRHNNIGAGAENVGLIYTNARFYVPGIGRFASADTIVPDPVNPQSFNRYSYVLNRPLTFTDPTGHHECADFTRTGQCVPIPKVPTIPTQVRYGLICIGWTSKSPS